MRLPLFRRNPYPEELFREYHERCPELFLVARRSRKVAGYSITCAGATRAELVSIAVSPNQRRAGVAQALLDDTVVRLKRAGVARFELMVRTGSEPAIAFYMRNGFTKVRTVAGYYGDGVTGIRMRKCL